MRRPSAIALYLSIVAGTCLWSSAARDAYAYGYNPTSGVATWGFLTNWSPSLNPLLLDRRGVTLTLPTSLGSVTTPTIANYYNDPYSPLSVTNSGPTAASLDWSFDVWSITLNSPTFSQLVAGISYDSYVVLRSNSTALQLGASAPLSFQFGGITSGVTHLCLGPTSSSAQVDVVGTSSGTQRTLTIAAEIWGYGFIKTGTGTLRLVGIGINHTNHHYGYTVINEGTLATTRDGLLGSTSAELWLNSGTFRADANFSLSSSRKVCLYGGGFIDTNGYDLTIPGTVYGAGILVKTGTGTFTLSGANVGTGKTYVFGGTLIVDNGLSNGSATGLGEVELYSGATLGGEGTIAGAVTANAGATIHPSAGLADDADRILVLGSLTTNAGSTLTFNLAKPKTDNDDSYSDIIATNNSLTFNSGTTLEFNLDNPYDAETLGYFTIMEYNPANPIVGLGNLTLPAPADGISYALSVDTTLGIVEVHRRFAGDINGDGIVDLMDLTILARNWKKPGTWATGDLNGDGFVDLADLTILARNWKKVIHDDYLIYLDDLSWADAMASVTFG
ncbi:MAG: dockerin type I domain-containing protein, partial [Phycisphaerales bacterium]|nr:dockerin type I domain-containing protein [Phycisphaerales bacterium]